MMRRFGISRETIQTFLSPVAAAPAWGLCFIGVRRLRGRPASSLQSDDTDQMLPAATPNYAAHGKDTTPMSTRRWQHGAVCRNNINFAELDQPKSPARIRLNSTVVWVKHDDDPEKSEFVSLLYTRDGKAYRVKARTAVMAGGGWTTRHVIRDLPQAQQEAYIQFYRSPCMMANVALRNWRFLYNMGMTGFRWFEGVGNYAEVRKTALIGADSATITRIRRSLP
jgi:spermidine dehydrogenase